MQSNRITDNQLLPREMLLKLARRRETICGIYFLFSADNEIVYVGQSKDILTRVEKHKQTKVFDRFAYVRCSPERLDILELAYILKFDPIYNVTIPNIDSWIGIKVAQRRLKEEKETTLRKARLVINRVRQVRGYVRYDDVLDEWDIEHGSAT